MQKINVSWHDDIDGLLLLQFEAGWSWSDFAEVSVQANTMIDRFDNPVVEIFDFQTSQQVPANMFKQGRQVLQQQPNSHLQAVILVTSNDYIHAVYRAFENVIPSSLFNKWNLTMTNTLEDAICRARQLLI